ncbi:MAG: Rpn family recombination-promoting nuclease/putative transposase [Anaeromicrobium sp.]|jgi:predicted transposase/invertase (TIGR01784 family)|uniref:Rpn family recombination-promoting nuclease/putative transposase n=1 Tax=Anaeromicrobium sp. TaxID=1929132 RepID=UPI0025ECE411|nr:Rpn family recombination-promoting nuclease/putative transposase [Anaeromicrobium sp.]MCT4594748.1 Rpn family recombination-promoting nuclease/putative transposase [Anaeromicrobium sp.]
MERLKPLNDFIFKKLFGENEVKDNLIAFLNAVLDRPDVNRLVSLEIIDNKELAKEMIDDKTGILDVRAKTADGMQINIEVQLTDQRNMDKRTLFYWGRLFNEGIGKGQDYKDLSKVITINILDFNYIELEKFHSKFHLWEDEEKDYMLTDLVEVHFIETPKFKNMKEKNLKGDKLQRWLTFLRDDISDETLKELVDMDKDIKKAEERLEHLSSDPKTLALYRAREKSLHERANMISSAREEEKIKIARSLLDVLDMETIALKTGLSIEQVKRLKH